MSNIAAVPQQDTYVPGNSSSGTTYHDTILHALPLSIIPGIIIVEQQDVPGMAFVIIPGKEYYIL